MSNLSMGLCGKLAKSVVWSAFVPLDSDLSTGYSYLPFGLYMDMTNIQSPQVWVQQSPVDMRTKDNSKCRFVFH